MNRLIPGVVFLFLMFLTKKTFSEQIMINIFTSVMERSCTISSGSSDFIVELMVSNVKDKKIGTPFSEKKFHINLENCPENINTVKIKFIGESDSIINRFLKIKSSDFSAAGIALGIYNINNENINISNNLTLFNIDHKLNNIKIEFIVAYIKTMEIVTPGKVIATTNFEIYYD